MPMEPCFPYFARWPLTLQNDSSALVLLPSSPEKPGEGSHLVVDETTMQQVVSGHMMPVTHVDQPDINFLLTLFYFNFLELLLHDSATKCCYFITTSS